MRWPVFWGFFFTCLLYSENKYLALFENARCGGILLQQDVVLTTPRCASENKGLIWPYQLEIEHEVIHPDHHLAILFLEHCLNQPGEFVQIFENSSRKKAIRAGNKVRFSNSEKTLENWIDSLDKQYFKVFYGLNPYLEGAPFWVESEQAGIYQIAGMMISDKIALRLEPYSDFISYNLKNRPQSNKKIIIPATVIPDNKSSLILEAKLETTPSPETLPLKQEPKSLGCICTQVRR